MPASTLPRTLPDVQTLGARHADSTAEDTLADLIGNIFRGEIALISSFGADAVVLLDMVARIDRETPILFLETGMLFQETLDYQLELAAQLDLRDVRLIRPDPQDLEMLDAAADLHTDNPDGCCYLRKTLPLRRALAPFAASITGRKRHQATSRASLSLFEPDGSRLKVNPLVGWSVTDVRTYIDNHNLPRHPLVAKGYPSIGCTPCTTPVVEGEDPRAGRWRGRDKIECGIHFDGTAWRPSGPDAVRRAFP